MILIVPELLVDDRIEGIERAICIPSLGKEGTKRETPSQKEGDAALDNQGSGNAET